MTDDETGALVDDAELRPGAPAVELAELFLERLEEAQSLHAMITVTPELALAEGPGRWSERRDRGERAAARRDADRAQGQHRRRRRAHHGRLDGSSPARLATEDAEVTRRLSAAGAVILGKAEHARARVRRNVRERGWFGPVRSTLRRPRPDSRRLERRLGRGPSPSDLCLAAIGTLHRRLGTAAGGALRGVGGNPTEPRRRLEPGVQPMAASLDTEGPSAGARGHGRSLPARRPGRVPPGHDPGRRRTTARSRSTASTK